MEDKSDCQRLYRNLIRDKKAVLEKPCVYLRQLTLCTMRCDAYNDLGNMRHAYYKHIGHDSFTRIMSFDETTQDERRALQAMVHHYDYTKGCLISSLGWLPWLRYYTVDKIESWLSRK